jgi:hypothetical protein
MENLDYILFVCSCGIVSFATVWKLHGLLVFWNWRITLVYCFSC